MAFLGRENAGAAEQRVPAVDDRETSAGGQMVCIAHGRERQRKVAAQGVEFRVRAEKLLIQARDFRLQFAHVREVLVGEDLIGCHREVV